MTSVQFSAADSYTKQLPATFLRTIGKLKQLTVPTHWLTSIAHPINRPPPSITALSCSGNAPQQSPPPRHPRPTPPKALPTPPPTLSSFPNLQSLTISDRHILPEQAVDQIAQLTRLTALMFQSITAFHPSFPSISRLPALRKLVVAGCDPTHTASLLPHLPSLTLLAHLDLQDSLTPSLPPTALEALSPLTRLTHLDLSWCTFSSASARRQLPLTLQRLVNLVHLHLEGCDRLTADSLPPLAALTALQTLSLAQCDHIAVHLLEFPPATTALNVAWNSTVTDDFLLHKVAPLPHLQRLCLARCSSITPLGLLVLSSLSTLTHLDLHKCCSLTTTPCLPTDPNVSTLSPHPVTHSPVPPPRHQIPRPSSPASTDHNPPQPPIPPHPTPGLSSMQLLPGAAAEQAVAAALGSWGKLRELDLWGCNLLVSRLWPAIIQLADLQSLSLRLCPDLPAAPALAHLSRLPLLTSLDLSRTNLSSAPRLAALARSRSLRTLRAQGCAALDDAALPALAPAARLATVDLRGCEGVTAEGVRRLLRGSLSVSRLLLSQRGAHSEASARLAEEFPQVRLHQALASHGLFVAPVP